MFQLMLRPLLIDESASAGKAIGENSPTPQIAMERKATIEVPTGI
jgi:hypothetical protein